MAGKTTPSPLAPAGFPAMPAIAGTRLAVAASGTRYKGRDDLMLLWLADTASIAGVFTKSATPGLPVIWTRDRIAQGRGRALLVNAGNANVFTGQQGWLALENYTGALASRLGLDISDILAASTGVIGEPLPDAGIIKCLDQLVEQLDSPDQGASWAAAAAAIGTTDTFAKGATASCEIAGQPVQIAGIAKGSGMIAPDMATMLGFIATDAALGKDLLQACLLAATKQSFNAITVDSDTSTSDMVLLAATGAAGNRAISDMDDPQLAGFRAALLKVMQDLACQIVRDGEGASKFITINISGAANDDSARKIGLAIGNSPLVKTAIAGEDANWGRIVMAVGKSGEPADRDHLSISIGGILIAANGQRLADYDETPVAAHMTGQDIIIDVDLGIGDGTARIWSCDLTHGYISINADYRS